MSPYFCHISNHLYDPCGDCDGCVCVHAFDNTPEPTTPLFGTVPGGFNDTQANRFHRDFDKGMYAYEKARKEGLQPKATTLDAVEEAQRSVKSSSRAVKKLSKIGDVSGLKVPAGVEV